MTTFTLYPERNSPMGAARIVRREKYAWPGGYKLALLVNDGELLCPACVHQNFSQISYAARHGLKDGWKPEAVVILEDTEAQDICAHCGKQFHE